MEEKQEQSRYNFTQASLLLKNSSVPAVSQLGHSDSKYRKIFWLVVLVVSAVGCIYEIYQWFTVYYNYPILINMDIENPLKMEFPAVTVCNLNRAISKFEACIKQGRPCQRLSDHKRKLFISEAQKVVSLLAESKSQRKLQEEKSLFIQNYSELDEKLRMSYGYTYFQMVKRCSFDGVLCYYYNFTLFQDKQYGNCYTFNSQDAQSTLISHHTGPDYGLEIEIDPVEYTYLDITPNVGFIVAIHNKGELPDFAADGINISPGYETHLAVTKSSIKRLPSPYRDKCFNYNSSAADAFIKSESDCIKMCMQNVSFSSCSCVDPSLPALEHMKACSLKNATSTLCLKNVLEKMHDLGLPCNCPLPCLTTSYEVQVSSSLWLTFPPKSTPSVSGYQNEMFSNISANYSNECHSYTEYIESLCHMQSNEILKDNAYNTDMLSQNRERKSLLKVFFKNFEHKIYTQEPAFTQAELYAHIGGHFNFWLGLSAVAIFECFQSVIFFLKTLRNK